MTLLGVVQLAAVTVPTASFNPDEIFPSQVPQRSFSIEKDGLPFMNSSLGGCHQRRKKPAFTTQGFSYTNGRKYHKYQDEIKIHSPSKCHMN